jgi:hypothetical protein
MSNWIKAETSKTCPVMSSAFGLIYFGSYGCLKCDFNLGYDKEAGMIKCCYESSLKLEKKPDLREDLRKPMNTKKVAYIAFGIAVIGMAITLIATYYFLI